MNGREPADRTAHLEEKIASELGDTRFLGVVPGTGWDKGVAGIFRPRLTIPYNKLHLPGAKSSVKGHSKTLQVGEISGRDAVVMGRVHPNENFTNTDIRQAMSLVIGALQRNLDGLVITNGVGTLHGLVGAEKGYVESLVRTAVLDLMGWAARGRHQENIGVGDVAIIDDVKTALVGPLPPLGAGEFPDFYHDGIHRDGDRYFDLVRRVVTAVQGRCPKAQSRFIAGPQFEGPADKVEFRSQGDDVVGMSGIQEILTCTRLDVPFAQLVLATNGPFGAHSHEGNKAVGARNAAKTARILEGLADSWPKAA